MNFSITHDITNDIYSTTIAFASWGGLDISGSEEKQLLTDEFLTYLDYNDITFNDKFKYDATKGIVVQDTTGDTISITSLVSQKILLNEQFTVTFQYDSKMVMASEITTNLPSAERVAEARCLLFESKINAQIQTLLTAVKAKRDNYLVNNPKNTTL